MKLYVVRHGQTEWNYENRVCGITDVQLTRLIEQDYGVFEGAFRDNKDFKEAKRHFPNKLSDGESILQVVQRIFNLLDEIRGKYKNQNVLL